jgi:large subunit ribosomal protein L21e
MVKRIGTSRSKTRHKFQKHIRQKGKIPIAKYLQEFNNGEKVVLKAEPSYQKSLYHQRFHGKIGVVKGKRGRSYIVDIKDFKKIKTIIIHPVHLKRF